MREPEVSVCIPTYNRRKYLRQALESVLAQTYTDFEVIVSDNCSSDDTAQVVRSFGDVRVLYFCTERNIGMVPNWNRAVRLARGKYVCVLEDDNWWMPTYLERTVATLDSQPQVAFVHTAAYLTDEEGRSRQRYQRWNEDRVCDGYAELKELLQGNKILLSTVTVRRRSYESVGVFDETIPYAPDWEMWLRLYIRHSGAYIAEPLALYRLHRGSETTRFHATPFLLFHDHRKVIDKTLHTVASVYGEPHAAELRHPAYRWLADFQMEKAWQSNRAGQFLLAWQEVALALRLQRAIALHYPLRVARLFLAALPGPAGRSFVAFEKGVARPIARQILATARTFGRWLG